MQPPTEAHLRLVEQEGGGFTVDSVDCPRVYHLNVVLRVRSRAAKRNTGRLMQLKSARIVADQARCHSGPLLCCAGCLPWPRARSADVPAAAAAPGQPRAAAGQQTARSGCSLSLLVSRLTAQCGCLSQSPAASDGHPAAGADWLGPAVAPAAAAPPGQPGAAAGQPGAHLRDHALRPGARAAPGPRQRAAAAGCRARHDRAEAGAVLRYQARRWPASATGSSQRGAHFLV